MASSSRSLPPVDHLVCGAPDLQAGIEHLERRLGVRAAFGGKHAGRGTHNALLALGVAAYLEILAPDPEQPGVNARPFGMDAPAQPRLVTWAVSVTGIKARVAAARAAGYDPGEVMAMSRDRPDGVRLQWRLALRPEPLGDGLVPFLIDWGDSPHPAATAPTGARLLALRLEHPHPDSITPALRALGLDMDVARAPVAAIVATIESPNGTVELR